VPFTVATFDCYGTLVDWEGGVGTFLYAHALASGIESPPKGRELRERWEGIQFGVIGGEYRPYREVLAESSRLLCAELGWPWSDGDGEAMVRAMQSWQPFPDTIPALERAKAAGMRLVILSNTDRAIIAHSLRQLEPVEFDDVIVAEDVASYKPAAPHFERARETLGVDPAEVLHVAFGFKYDIAPAQAAGFSGAWVNRHREPRPGDAVPDHEWRDLWGLAELAEAQAG
jgi:2-haloalkanoic acid dehalogenase type II